MPSTPVGQSLPDQQHWAQVFHCHSKKWFSDAAKSTQHGIADLHHLQPRPMPQLPGLRGCLGRLQGGSRHLLGLGVLPLQGLQYGLQTLGKHCDDLFLSFPLATVQSSQLVLGGLVSLHLLERAGTFPVHRCWLPGGQKTFG